MGKTQFESIFLRKSLNFRTKIENFWLATWFMFELIGLRNASDLTEHKLVKMFLSNDDQSNIHFLSYISQKIVPHSSF